MQQIHKELTYIPAHPLMDELFTDHTIFFDIETTGFSPKSSQLYLIGCATRRGDMLCIDQFFADSAADEAAVLTAFLTMADIYDTIITFNGTGFDIPYLKNKCNMYHIAEHFSDYTYLDIYKQIAPLKRLLSLENVRQKTVEQFLHIARDDKYSGGELIELYKDYTRNPTEESLSLLLLHNYEDVLGMPKLLQILAYEHLFKGEFTGCPNWQLYQYTNLEGILHTDLILRLTPKYALPQPFSYHMENIYLSAEDTLISLNISLTEGELKHFYPNYKDYYYLPHEDTAIHKSVAFYVEKEFRKPAKAATCYTKKKALFLPQYDSPLITPDFYIEYKDKTAYFAYDEALLADEAFRMRYASQLLKRFLGKR